MYQEQSSSPLGHGRHLLIQCIVDAIRNSLRIRVRLRSMAPGGISVAEWPRVVSPEREEISTKFQRLPRHFRPRPLQGSYPQCPMSADYLKSIWRPSNRKLIVSPEREEISTKFQTATPDIFDHAPLQGSYPTMPDVGRLLKINMAAVKPEVDCISGTGRDINEIPTATLTFSTTPTSRELSHNARCRPTT
jgi:hypothetical protein